MAAFTLISHNLPTTPYHVIPYPDTPVDDVVPNPPPTPRLRTNRPGTQVAPHGAKEVIENDSEMWKMFLDEVNEEDNRFTGAWKEDANSIVTFTALFSAIVGAFIIEFYKKLSADSGSQTVALLQQISHQLPNSPNSANSNTASQLSSISSPGTAMVWANALWLISLVLSLTCALTATLLQQWARRYTETPKSPKILRHRARVRSLLLVGTRLYNIPLIVEMLPTLLHLSVYLFLGGLVITFHTIHKTVAIAVDVAVGVSGLAYMVLSILPCLDVRCPYRTPISKILWYPCHALLSLAALCLHRCILGLHKLLHQRVLSREQRVLLRWLQSRGFSVSNHWRFLTDGLEKSIVHRAVEAPKAGDGESVTWLFNQLALGDKHKFLKFANSIPRHRIPDLILPIESISIQEPLLYLLRSCVASRYTASPDEDVHERSLLVCLHAIRHIVKAKAPSIREINFMRAHFANIGLMRPLWDDMDVSIRIISRSICALVARHVVRKRRLVGYSEEVRWLEGVTRTPSDEILKASVTVRDQMNFKSFVNGALPNHLLRLDLSIDDVKSFKETLAILLGIRTDGHDYFTTPDKQIRLSEEVGRIQQNDPEGGRELFNKLRLIFPSLSATPPIREIPPSREASPHRRVSPPRAASPYRGVPPPRAASPYRGVPPPRAASPYRGVPPPRAASPYRGVPPPRAASPYRGVPPPRAASPYYGVPPPRAVPPLRAVPPRAVTPPGGHATPLFHPIPSPRGNFLPVSRRASPLPHPIPSPHVTFLPGPIPSRRATPLSHPIPRPHAPPPPRATRSSRRARSPHAPM